MADTPSRGVGTLAGGILVFVLLGFPLLAYVWETLNQLLSGTVDGRRLLVTIPALLLLIAVLVWLSRTVRRWEAARH